MSILRIESTDVKALAAVSKLCHLCRKPILFGLGTAEAKGKVAASLKGRFSMARSDQHRGIDMSVEYSAQFTDGSLGPSEVQIFSMTMSS